MRRALLAIFAFLAPMATGQGYEIIGTGSYGWNTDDAGALEAFLDFNGTNLVFSPSLVPDASGTRSIGTGSLELANAYAENLFTSVIADDDDSLVRLHDALFVTSDSGLTPSATDQFTVYRSSTGNVANRGWVGTVLHTVTGGTLFTGNQIQGGVTSLTFRANTEATVNDDVAGLRTLLDYGSTDATGVAAGSTIGYSMLAEVIDSTDTVSGFDSPPDWVASAGIIEPPDVLRPRLAAGGLFSVGSNPQAWVEGQPDGQYAILAYGDVVIDGDLTADNLVTDYWYTINGNSGTMNPSGQATLTVQGAGINSVTASGGTLTVTGTEVDGSTTNELQNLFQTISTSSGSAPVADSTADTLTLTASGIVTVTGNSTTDTVTIGATEADTLASVTARGATTGDAVTLTNTATNALTVYTGANIRRASSSGTDAANLFVTRYRGSAGSETAVQSGDLTGRLIFRGYSGTSDMPSARITGIVDGTVSTGSVPQAIEIATGTSSTPSGRMRVHSSGLVEIHDGTLGAFSLATGAGDLGVEGDAEVLGNMSVSGNATLSALYAEYVELGNGTGDVTVDSTDFRSLNLFTAAGGIESDGLIRTDNGTNGSNGTATGDGDIYAEDALEVDGNSVLGDASTDTTSVNGDLAVNTDDLFVDASSARTGIGTSSPSATLDVVSGASANVTALRIAQEDDDQDLLSIRGYVEEGGFPSDKPLVYIGAGLLDNGPVIYLQVQLTDIGGSYTGTYYIPLHQLLEP